MIADHAHQLREQGIYVTAQRLAVLRVVGAQPHASAEAVLQGVREEIGSISRQSVYDALNTLSDVGLLRRIQPMGSTVRYETRTRDNHHHVICRSCGRAEDVDCAVGQRPCLTASEAHGFDIDEAEVIYWGRCPDCASDSDTAHPDPSPPHHTQRGKP